MKIHKTTIRPILTYAVETIRDTNKLVIAQRRILRTILAAARTVDVGPG